MAILEEPIKEVLKLKNYINGEWVESKAKQVQDVVNPATQRVIARVPMSTKDEVTAAIQAAKEAFPDWRRTPPVTRARCLFRLKELMEENFEELSRIQTMEHGKTIDESRGETRRGIEMVEVATGIPSLMMGYNLEDIATGIDEYVIYQPLGVFCHIAPFNFPFMLANGMALGALITGNTIVLKPTSEAPLTGLMLYEIYRDAGVPNGVVNYITGPGPEFEEEFTSNPDVAGIAFTGSRDVGLRLRLSHCLLLF